MAPMEQPRRVQGIMNQFSREKILHHTDRMAEWISSGISRPITFELDMTNVCNSKCSFCFGFSSDAPERSSISLPQARSIIRQIKALGGKGLTFTGGGEPLCNPATVAAVRFAKQSGLDVGFITNGILLTPETARVLASDCTWIRVSLDAGSRTTYRLTHGLNSDTFDRVIENISLLVKAKKTLGSHVTIGTGFITFPAVIRDMVPFVTLSRRLGVDYTQFRPLLKKFRQQEINVVPDAAILRELDRCAKLSRKGFSVVCSVHKYAAMRTGTVTRAYDACYGHHFATVIAANRKMYLCCHMRGLEKYCIGDLSTHTLREIWRSARRRRVYERISFNDCPLLCRCDGFNTILWNMRQPQDHLNFL